MLQPLFLRNLLSADLTWVNPERGGTLPPLQPRETQISHLVLPGNPEIILSRILLPRAIEAPPGQVEHPVRDIHEGDRCFPSSQVGRM